MSLEPTPCTWLDFSVSILPVEMGLHTVCCFEVMIAMHSLRISLKVQSFIQWVTLSPDVLQILKLTLAVSFELL